MTLRLQTQTLTVPAGEITLATLAFAADEPLSSFPPCPYHADAAVRRLRHFLAGRHCAHQALATAGHNLSNYLDRDESGLPQWPQPWLGSISHTEGQAVAAVAAMTNFSVLGVDVEQVMPPQRAQRLHDRLATTDELDLLADFEPALGLTLVFSGKEALYKALYPHTGNYMGFDAARLRTRSDNELTFELTRDWSAAWTQTQQIRVSYRFSEGYVCTLAWWPQR